MVQLGGLLTQDGLVEGKRLVQIKSKNSVNNTLFKNHVCFWLCKTAAMALEVELNYLIQEKLLIPFTLEIS